MHMITQSQFPALPALASSSQKHQVDLYEAGQALFGTGQTSFLIGASFHTNVGEQSA